MFLSPPQGPSPGGGEAPRIDGPPAPGGSAPLQPLSREHARAAAELHRSAIDTGFLSSLGSSFLRQIYLAIPACPSGFGFVWRSPDGRVQGFIACAESTGRLYRQALRRRGLRLLLPIAGQLLRPSVLRRILHTLRYPSQTGADLPAAEVLSIAISDELRGQGVGKALMTAALEEFRRRGIGRVRVAVGAANTAANTFYRRCGFRLALTREHHGRPMNIYVIGD